MNLISHGQSQITAACKIGHMSALRDLDTCCSPQQFVDELHRQNQKAQVLAGNLSDAELNWQPNAGKSWSIGQCLEHLAATNTLYEGAMRDANRTQSGPRPVRLRGLSPSRMALAQVHPVDGASADKEISRIPQDYPRGLGLSRRGGVIAVPCSAAALE